jgi:hypothetical protein
MQQPNDIIRNLLNVSVDPALGLLSAVQLDPNPQSTRVSVCERLMFDIYPRGGWNDSL